MLNAACLLATLAVCAAALPAANQPAKRATVSHNGHLVDCDQTAFLDIYPPTEIELKCRAAQGIPSDFKPRDINARDTIVEFEGRQVNCDETAFLDIYPPTPIEQKCREAWGVPSDIVRREPEITARDTIVEFEGRQINCDEIAFLAVMPPSELELKCRAAWGKQDPIPVEGGWELNKRAITGVVVGKRHVVDFKGGKLNCEGLVFPAVFPPTEAEVACRGGERVERIW
ncbi:hypothetical protein PRZ48_010092 [Zasmidium cellare]|uniref:Uncharacterized protein n=1 Tax=Zasmidium cellare TaxID=395010 RepID=A0ABR0EEL1_ZASCE|nr:hypothetical protein PRZ48_010092 [Zasmidium cellare]